MRTVRRSKRPTLALVAKEAGVSIGTASNILNNKLELHSPETVKRVLGVAQKMGYRPSGAT
ncbi:MAG: LacI family DNA-binding transcriptional regulator, partial [Fimbriimonadales bacterium]